MSTNLHDERQHARHEARDRIEAYARKTNMPELLMTAEAAASGLEPARSAP